MAGCCYFFQEGFSIFLPVTVLYLGALAAMASHFKGINDAFKIKNEISHICAATAITSGVRSLELLTVIQLFLSQYLHVSCIALMGQQMESQYLEEFPPFADSASPNSWCV